MNLETYKRNRQLLRQAEPQFRVKCMNCRQPEFSCYCHKIESFDPKVEFIILIHPLEVRRRIATGRMSHLCLQNSLLFEGQDFSQDVRITQIVQDPKRDCMILYPGPTSTNLTQLSEVEKQAHLKTNKKRTIFVIDGTWRTARKMVRSTNIIDLPRVCFSPERPSNFRVRKQPHPNCYSTIEAIHHLLELMGPINGLNLIDRKHDALINVFDHMVELQLDLIRKSSGDTNSWRQLKPRNKLQLDV